MCLKNCKHKKFRNVYRGMKKFKMDNKPITNFVKDERGDLLPGPHKILNRWKNYVCRLLKVHVTVLLRRLECIQPSHLCHSLVPQTETVIEKLKGHKKLRVEQMLKLLIQVWGNHKIKLILNKKCLSRQWKESIAVPIHIHSDKTVWSNYRSTSLLPI
jgi:hypothetical protein